MSVEPIEAHILLHQRFVDHRLLLLYEMAKKKELAILFIAKAAHPA
jgi:hypothetical protein